MPIEPSKASTLDVLKQVVRALDDKKAEDVRVLHVTAQSSITDYLVLANGNSEPHLRALRVELEKVLDSNHVPIAGMESGEFGSGWTVVDAYQIMVHLFTAEQRENYALENLWKDAEEMPVKKLVAPPKAPAKKRVVKKAAGAKRATSAKKAAPKKRGGKAT